MAIDPEPSQEAAKLGRSKAEHNGVSTALNIAAFSPKNVERIYSIILSIQERIEMTPSRVIVLQRGEITDLLMRGGVIREPSPIGQEASAALDAFSAVAQQRVGVPTDIIAVIVDEERLRDLRNRIEESRRVLPATKDVTRFASLLDGLRRSAERCKRGILRSDEWRRVIDDSARSLDTMLEHDSDLWREMDLLKKKTAWTRETATGYADMSEAGDLTAWVDFTERCARAFSAPTHESATLSNQPYEALKQLHSFMKRAANELLIVDNYLKEDIFDLLGQDSIPKHIQIRMLTKEPTKAFKAHLRAFSLERGSIQVRLATDIHDRFIVVDKREVLHCGTSIQGAGIKLSRISCLQDGAERQASISQIEDSWRRAKPLEG